LNSERYSRSGAAALTIWMAGVAALWYIAFSPISTTTPEWLIIVRDICFGTREDGMPAGYGWLTLFFSPVSMLIAIFLIWSKSVIINTVIYSLKKRSLFFIIFTLLISLLFFEIFWVFKKLKIIQLKNNISYESLPQNNKSIDSYQKIDAPFPRFSFYSRNENNIETLYSNKHIKGPAVVTFAYAHCETICPVIIKNSIRGVENFNQIVSKNQTDTSAKVYIISLDPWRDTPSMSKMIADQWKLPPDASIITSHDEKKINQLLDDLDVNRSRNEKTGEIIHPALVYILDSNSRIIFKLNNPDSRLIRDALNKGIE